jgi:hypothetical protein
MSIFTLKQIQSFKKKGTSQTYIHKTKGSPSGKGNLTKTGKGNLTKTGKGNLKKKFNKKK